MHKIGESLQQRQREDSNDAIKDSDTPKIEAKLDESDMNKPLF